MLIFIVPIVYIDQYHAT